MAAPCIHFGNAHADLVSVMERVRAESGRMIRWAPLAKKCGFKNLCCGDAFRITGVYVVRKNHPVYPKQLAAHMIGYINHESQARSMIEQCAITICGGKMVGSNQKRWTA